MTGWSSLPLKFKIYISAIVITAIPIFFLSIKYVVSKPVEYPWLILTAITLATVPIFVRDPHVRSLVTIGDAYVISICMMFGTQSAIVANILYISYLTLLLRRSHNTPVDRIIFNIATAAINVQLYGFVFWKLQSFDKILLPTFGLALTFFLSNSLFIAAAISLSTSTKVLEVWRKNYVSLVFDFLVSACAGAFIVFFTPTFLPPEYRYIGPILAAPFVGVILRINKVNRARALQAEAHLREQEQLYLRTVETLAVAVDAKDQTTYGHIRRVRAYALGLAKLKGITDPIELKAIDFGSLLHDIGKLAIDDYILNKPGRLNKQEFEKMKLHATAGDEILQKVEFPFPVARFVRCHHERWDGKGYPAGLRGEEIPLGARILSIADAFDAIRSSRPYKSSFSLDDSIELLRTQAGNSYDPTLVELFINNIHDLEAAANEAGKNISELSFRKYFETVDSAISRADASLAEQPLPASASDILIRLNEFCGGVGRSLELAVSLPFIARRLAQIVPYNSCVFYLYQEEDDLIRADYAFGDLADSLLGIKIKLGQRISGYVAAHERPMCNADPAREFEGMSKILAPFKAALVVPLVHDEDCLGTISLYNNNSDFYTQTHLTLLNRVVEQLAPLLREVSGTDTLDPVTGLPRISYLTVAGSQALAHAEKSEAPLSLLYLKIKSLRQSAALYGSGSGDLILRKVADILRSELRQTDILIRYGEDGFIALLPGVSGPQAIRYLNRLLQLIKSSPVSLAPGNTSSINCHAAVASYPNEGSNPLALLEAAQRSLFNQERLDNPQVAAPEGNVFEFPPRI
jgi:diguanylate cyclase (GGDEF)-like protein/putative nucleotidyltransferase with HDIG domain